MEAKAPRQAIEQMVFSRQPDMSNLESLLMYVPLAPLKVNLWRNHGVERVAGFMTTFLKYMGKSADISISEYDDSLSFVEFSDADFEIVWIDSKRYAKTSVLDEFQDWLAERVEYLRFMSSSPILIVDQDGNLQGFDIKCVGIAICDLTRMTLDPQKRLLDDRWLEITGSRINPHSQVEIARWITLKIMGGVISPPVKLVVLDLDGTMYKGVIGEDGPLGLDFNDNHLELQRLVSKLQDEGVFVSIVSKNNEDDVKLMMKSNPRWQLHYENLVFPKVGWSSKSDSILEIVRELNIGIDSVLVIDDNPGEVAQLTGCLGEAIIVQADSDAWVTRNALELTPGIWRWSNEGAQDRIADVQAQVVRKSLEANSDSRLEYLNALNMQTTISVDKMEEIQRSFELSQKTNQFNLSLSRLSEMQLRSVIDSPNRHLITATLEDKFSKSGIVLLMILRWERGKLLVEELCLSCRALGRDVETALIASAIRSMPGSKSFDKVYFQVVEGPRNEPSTNWLMRFSQLEASKQISMVEVHVRDLIKQADEGPNVAGANYGQ